MHTIVIAAYNCSPWIRQTIDDVFAQTDTNWELIVVDDGSTDSTGDVVSSYSDPRVRYVRQENSGSPAKPRNHGLHLARGEWITFLDHDDRWRKNRLEKVNAVIKSQPEVDVICHDQNIVSKGQIVGRARTGHAGPNLYLDMLMHGNQLTTSATTVRTERARAMGGFDERKEFFTVEDFDLWLKLAHAGCRFHFIHETLGDYILHPEAMTRNRDRHFQAMRSLARHHSQMAKNISDTERNRILAYCEYALAREHHKEGRLQEALAQYREAYAKELRSVKLLVGWIAARIGVRI